MNIRNLSLFTISFLLLLSCSGTEPASEDYGESEAESHGVSHEVHWGYETDNGPVHWGSMKPEWILCDEGREQSPIDLTGATAIELPAVEIDTPSDQEAAVLNQEGVIEALDNGHTIQINTQGAERLSVGEEAYALMQFHFHAPSEHTTGGEHFPMEMHFVHQAEDGALAVLGLLIEEGAENPG